MGRDLRYWWLDYDFVKKRLTNAKDQGYRGLTLLSQLGASLEVH